MDVLNAGVAMGSADEELRGEKAEGDAAGGFSSPRANGPPGAGAAAETARGTAQTIASGEAKTMKPSARSDSASSAAEVEAKPWRMMQALVVMVGSEDGASPKSADAVALLGGKEGLAPGDLVHRGMVNTGNGCYRNSVLQALLACEPFVRQEFPLVFLYLCSWAGFEIKITGLST